MGQGHNNDDDDDRKDLTRIEDLSEFLHEEDPDLESKFGDFTIQQDEGTSTELTGAVNLDELDVPPAVPSESEEAPIEFQLEEDLIEMPETMPEEDATEAASDLSFSDETPFQLSTEENEFNLPTSDDFQLSEEETEEAPAEFIAEINEEYVQAEDATAFATTPEKFEDVKSFAQNFSYGQIQGGGNPPFSLVVRNLKYEEEKEDIISLLTEFGLANSQNTEEITRALEIGSLLVPQISEYSAIVLAHKLRRYDCDIEIGLSDEVHPSKSGEQNPRGLIKKDSLRQNKIESYHKDEDETPAKEIIVSTTSTLEGYIIKKYIGVQTTFAIVDEDELERLKHVQTTKRANSPIHNYETEESTEITSERAFIDYQSSFEHLFVELLDQLKAKAMKEKANALLGLNYQLSAMPFEKTSQGKNCYQLTASATMAVVKSE